VVAAGANVVVAGSAVFGESQGVIATMNRRRAAVNHVGNHSEWPNILL
jgi:pentose-5-phosphate-3-epimerase